MSWSSQPSAPTITNCIVWDNNAGSAYQEIGKSGSSNPSVTYCDVQGGYAGGNINAEPLLTPDGHLLAGSPCIDSGTLTGAPEVDQDGEGRPHGAGVDMGIDEFIDTDGDGLPDFWEQEYFGDPIAADPDADPDGDGVTNIEEYELYGINPIMFDQRIIYVDDSATGSDDGTSWMDAFTDLQDALTVAAAYPRFDEIRVAQGIYTPTEQPGDREVSFQLIGGVAIRGGYAGFGAPDPNERDIGLYETVLSGDLNGNDVDVNDPLDLLDEPTRAENSYHVVTGNSTDPNTILDGFTITAGNANGPRQENHNRGGGMQNHQSSPTLTNCTFSGNSAHWNGGGMQNHQSSPTLTNCTFSGNSAGGGGGMNNGNFSNPTLVNCTFNNNLAVGSGGGMTNHESSPMVTNCTFSNNSTGGVGGGMHNHESSPTVTNCTFSGNSARWEGGGMNNFVESSLTVTNCILWGNTASSGSQIFKDWTSSASVSYTDVQGGWPGTGNINADPCFVNPDSNDFHLLPASACIDAGDNTAVPPDTLDLDSDGDTAEPIPIDLAGNQRFVDQADVPDTGNGTAPIVDMGAYEANYIEVEMKFTPQVLNLGSKGGLLNDGRNFYGTDTIRIIDKSLEYVAVLAAHWLEADCGVPDWCGGADVDQDSVVNLVHFAMFDGCCIEVIEE